MHVEKNIPIPEDSGHKGRPPKYPFSSMKIGDSVFFEGEKTGGNPYVAAKLYARKRGWDFVGRTESTGLRIWRVE